MRFNVDRICELAGLGAASGGLLSEAAPAVPAGKKPAAMPMSIGGMGASAKPAAAPPKTAAAPVKPSAPPPKAEGYMEDEDLDLDEMYMSMDEEAFGDDYEDTEEYLEDDKMYEIDETDLMEALVTMRQQRLEESSVRDVVQDEIRRALADRSGSWVYGSNKPSASRVGLVSRGGFGLGFK
jgi:hypothetical protein